MNQPNGPHNRLRPGRKIITQSAGVKVSATNAERLTETESVKANCR